MSFVARLLACLVLFVFLGGVAGVRAQDRRQNQPGQFDFYVLSLSWSPSFCAANAERSFRRPDPQCGPRPFSFVVHGMWPQYERGFPEFCQVPSPRLYRNIVTSMLDLMPSPRLVYHEWDRHGTCSGLSASAFFDTVRKARAVVKIPPAIYGPAVAADRHPRPGRGRLRCRQSGAHAGGHRRHLRRPAARRGPGSACRGISSSAAVRRRTAAPAGATGWSCRRCAAADRAARALPNERRDAP